MATEIAAAYVSLVPSFRGGSRAISSALASPVAKAGPEAGRSLGRGILGGVAKAAAVGGGIVAALGLANLGKEAVKAAAGLQNTTATLTGLLGSAKAAQETMTALRDVARKSPISYQAYLEAAEAMAYMGYQGEEAAGILENVGAAVTAAGGDDEAIGNATAAMLKMVNSGKVYAAQLNQISQTGVPIFSALADHFDTSIAKVREMVTAGEVSIDDVMTAIKNASGPTFQAMIAASEGASQTLTNQWKIAKDNIVVALGEQLLPIIDSLTPAMRKFGEVAPGIIAGVAAKIIGGMVAAARAVFEFGSTAINAAKGLKPYWDALFGRGDEYSSSPIIRGLLRINDLLQSVRREINIMPRRVWFGEIRNDVLEGFERARDLVQTIRREVNTFPRTGAFAHLMDRVESIKTDTLSRFSSIWSTLRDTFVALAPSAMRIAQASSILIPAMAKASASLGVSAWSLFLAVADSLAKLLSAVLVPAVDLLSRALKGAADYLAENEGAARALVLVYTGWKLKGIVTAVIGLTTAIIGKTTALWASTTAFLANTKATVANALAKARSIAMTGAIVALYIRDAVAKGASTAATIASTVATKGLTIAQRALNLVMRANPIGIVITILAALVAAIILAWKRSETFRNVVTTVWNAIQAAAKFAWERIILPIFKAYVAYLKTLWNAAVTAKDFIVAAWNAIRSGLGAAWGWIRRNVIDRAIAGFQWVRDKVVAVKDGIVNAWGILRNALHSAWVWMRDNAIDPLRRRFQAIWDKAVEVKDGIVNAFKSVANSIAGVFDNVVSAIKGALNTVFGWINRNMIRHINKVTEPFGLEIPSLPKLHKGGHVPGRGEKPYMLLGGEAVLNPKAAKALGRENIDALNKGLGIGGWPDWASWDTIKQGLALGYDTARGATALENGLLSALKGIRSTVLKGIDAVIPGPEFVEKPVVGQTKKFLNSIVGWAEKGHDKISVPDDFGQSFGAPGPLMGGGWRRPLSGYRISRGSAGHGYAAIDLAAPTGTNVYSARDGRVSSVRRLATSYGHHVRVSHGGGFSTLYAHLSRIVASIGQRVRTITKIGEVGSTGNSTGPHLHFEVLRGGRRVEPTRYVRFDTGMGVLKPGHSLVYNGTGADEPLVDPRRYSLGGGNVVFNTYGTPKSLVNEVAFEMRKRALATQMVGVS